MMLKATITVPSTQRDGNPVQDRNIVLNAVCAKLSRAFGGCTLVDGTGHWQDANGNNVQESVTVATSFITGPVAETATETMTDIGQWLKECCDQDCVLVTIEPVNNVIWI